MSAGSFTFWTAVAGEVKVRTSTQRRYALIRAWGDRYRAVGYTDSLSSARTRTRTSGIILDTHTGEVVK